MMYSMTAFGRGIHTAGGMTFTVEMRAVNGRYLDISCRMPRALLPLEEKIKSYIQNRVTTRGKVDVNVTLTREGVSDKTVTLDAAYADAYMAALRALRDRLKRRGKARAARADDHDVRVRRHRGHREAAKQQRQHQG